MADLAIAAHGVSKRFATHSARATSLKERLIRRGTGGANTTFWALRELDIDVQHGESVALMGANGSGKSTLLKVMAGIIRPTTGTVETHGRIASLLELGAGFNSELTGRENIFLNASLLGLSRKETTELYDAIVEFSELGEFIEAPVKHYSSGMYVRLGFSVAVHIDPDILLVDEVLAVGDEHFQRKCLAKIAQFQDQGRTILFVSHSSALVERVCSRAIVLDHGKQVFDGDPYFASAELSKLLGTDRPEDAPDEVEDGGLSFGEVVYSARPGGAAITAVAPHEQLTIRVNATVDAHWIGKIDRARVVVMAVGDIPIWTMSVGADQLPRSAGHWMLDFSVDDCPPLSGRFLAAIQFFRGEDLVGVHRADNAFEVTSDHRVGLIKVGFTAATAVTDTGA